MVDLRKILNSENNEDPEIKIRIQINPIFIEGKYKKLIRDIPQTKWPCRKCKGKGCSEGNGTEREDIDVRMLGDGLPFVLKIKEPKKRKLDLEKINKLVNEYSKGKTEYNYLKFAKEKEKLK